MTSATAIQLLSRVLFVSAAQLGGFNVLSTPYDVNAVLSWVMMVASIASCVWLVSRGQMHRVKSISVRRTQEYDPPVSHNQAHCSGLHQQLHR